MTSQPVEEVLNTEVSESKSKPDGFWGILLKVHLAGSSVAFSLLVGWVVWVTSELYKLNSFASSGERFSKEDARVLEARQIEARNMMRTSIEAKLTAQSVEIKSIQRDTDRILVILEREQ